MVALLSRELSLYHEKTPMVYRVTEGLTTGCMMILAMISDQKRVATTMKTYEHSVYFFQWIASFLFHVAPTISTVYLDWLTIQELILMRLSRVNPFLGMSFRYMYTVYHVIQTLCPVMRVPPHILNQIMATIATFFMSLHIDTTEAFLAYIGYSLLSMVAYELKLLFMLVERYRVASLMSSIFHVFLGCVVYVEYTIPDDVNHMNEKKETETVTTQRQQEYSSSVRPKTRPPHSCETYYSYRSYRSSLEKYVQDHRRYVDHMSSILTMMCMVHTFFQITD